MSLQNIRITVRPASAQVNMHDVPNENGDHDAISEMSGPPDYATIDPNDLNRSITPFPRPKSPTPSQTGNWPLASADDEHPPDSSTSYTSAGPSTRRAKSQGRKFRRNSPKNVNRPEPIAERRNRKRALSTGSTPGSAKKKTTLQVPVMARLASRRSENGLPRFGSSASMSTTLTNNNPFTGDQKKPGLVSSLSRGDWTTIGSFFSQSVNSTSPQRGVGGREISQPFDFRHEGGIGSSSSAFLTQPHNTMTTIGQADHEAQKNDQTRTSSVLMDMRTESRLCNRTSLPVKMPNAFSPIDTTVFDADCGHDPAVRASVRTTINRFQSPPTPEEDLWHGQSSADKTLHGHDTVLGQARIDTLKVSISKLVFAAVAILCQVFIIMAAASITITVYTAQNGEKTDGGAIIALIVSLFGVLISGTFLALLYAHRLGGRMVREYTGVRVETFLFKMSPERAAYWGVASLTEVAFLSTAAALTVVVVRSRAGHEASSGVVAWLVVSLAVFVILGSALSVFFARRVSDRIVRNHRAEQRDEEWVEMHSGARRDLSHHPGDQSRLARDILQSATQDMQQQQHRRGPRAPDRAFSTQLQLHPRASLIGIARSDSLMRHPNQTPSMSSAASTYESEHTEKPIMPKRASRSCSPAAVHVGSDPTTPLSAEDMSMIFMAKHPQPRPAFGGGSGGGNIPHSLAVADLASEAAQAPGVSRSGTKSTIASLISSYASAEPGCGGLVVVESVERAFPPETLARRQPAVDDALHSRLPALLRPIVTEAGTPNSQKSGDRVVDTFVEVGGGGGLRRDWSFRDGHAARLVSMTPIEERSEAGTRSSLLTTGRRASLLAHGSEKSVY
ncbi:hypothetical protein TruAng_001586 [Truncatella angustata]|nr:hypothetical protein TruAng_001586 [Truncatella angustata]